MPQLARAIVGHSRQAFELGRNVGKKALADSTQFSVLE